MNSRILCLVLLLCVLLTALPLHSNTGIGIILGDPTGLSLRFNNFPVLAIAWSLDKYLQVNCDYWINNNRLQSPFSWYWGLGAKVLFYSDNNEHSGVGLGLRVPLGIQAWLNPRLEVFGEIAPGLHLIPSTDFDLDAGLGIRFYI